MQNWFDLTRAEKEKLKNEFKKRYKVSDLRIFFYIGSFIIFFIFIFILLLDINMKNQNFISSNDKSLNPLLLITGLLFIISISLALMNSVELSKNEKNFVKWLRARNIDK